MKKAFILLAGTAALLCTFLCGFLVGRNTNRVPATISALIPAATVPEYVEAGKVNINTASVSELDALPGIGSVIAQQIVDYREENGPFTALEELLNVKNIGEGRLQAILDYITLGGSYEDTGSR